MSKAPAPAEAARIILSRVTLLPAVQSSLRELPGRILRQDVQAERDNPPFDRVCMDGVAIDSRAFASGIRRFRIQATQAAGAVPLTIAGLDSAVEIMTGAVLPHGADCVIPLEEYDLDGDGLQLKPEATAEPWRNLQRRGSDSSPDPDADRGDESRGGGSGGGGICGPRPGAGQPPAPHHGDFHW
ncbi:MAG: hypothetical protein IPG49_00110 [Proteobacteria bacterium]|nr:hypothetical protein [Pseudomonadota bacterium]